MGKGFGATIRWFEAGLDSEIMLTQKNATGKETTGKEATGRHKNLLTKKNYLMHTFLTTYFGVIPILFLSILFLFEMS